MSKVYNKWRDHEINVKNVDFKIDKIISYPPAGNEVYEVISDNKHYFIKVEKSKMADFESEKKNIKTLKEHYNKIPDIIKYGIIEGKKYIILSKIEGERLSDLISEKQVDSIESYELYGQELALIHKTPIDKFNKAKQRVINDVVLDDRYINRDNFIKEIIDNLKNSRPNITFDTFIHGDFHYANILWLDGKISGVIDFEYSGKGFKEQDIAWALIPRPSQPFETNLEEINAFLKGYSKINEFNKNSFKWTFINGCVHFYLMNNDNEQYKQKLKNLIENIEEVLK